jgi:predicted nucleic acid-binding protein
MTHFVLDNSVAMRWHLQSEKLADQKYAEAVLVSLSETEAMVPNLWHLEATNILLGAEKRGVTTVAEIEGFISQLENLPLHVDPITAAQSFSRIMTLARAYKLSSYDAAYLELAIRKGLSIATLDADLVKAAKKAGVPLYLRRIHR